MGLTASQERPDRRLHGANGGEIVGFVQEERSKHLE